MNAMIGIALAIVLILPYQAIAQQRTISVVDGVEGSVKATVKDYTNSNPLAVINVDTNGNPASSSGVAVAEDAAHSSGENIAPLGCRRKDAAATSAGADGDWATVDCDANGALRVRIDSTAVGSTSTDDDGTVTAGTASMSEVLGRNYVYDGTNWVRQRLTVGIEDAAETAGGGLSMSGTVRRDTAASSAGTAGDNATLNTDATGLLWTRTIDPCSSAAKTFLPISISTATTTEITPSLAGASTNYYVCSLVLVTNASNIVTLVDDDSDGCGSPTAGMSGGTTTAGWTLAANGGLAFGNGMGSIFKTNGANRVICLVTSAATQLSGTMTVVAAP